MKSAALEARKYIAALAPYSLADLSVPNGTKQISLAQNESAVQPSPVAISAAHEAMAMARYYPDPNWAGLRTAISVVHGIDSSAILCGAGTMELIGAISRCYLGEGDRALVSEYGYAFFKTAALSVGACCDSAREHELVVNIDALAAAVRSETKVVFIANPGNPTGTRVSRRELLALRTMLPHRILLVVDEAYGEFVDVGEDSMFDLPTHTNTVILRTFSKAYGLAGMRVGWGMFPQSIAEQVRKVLNPNNVSAPSQAAAEAAMRDQPYMRDACQAIVQRRDRFALRIKKLGLGVTESFTNFVLIRFPAPDAARQAERALRSSGVLLRGLAGYNLADSLRATVGSEQDMLFAGRLLQHWCSQEGIAPAPV